MSTAKPLVSVVIAAKDARSTIRTCLDSVLKLTYPCFEVIVADDGSADGTGEILASFGKAINVLSLDHAGASAARNRAVSAANGEFVAFTDSDCLVAPDWLDQLLLCFVSGDVVAGGGTQASPADESAFGRRVHRFFTELGFAVDYLKQRRGICPVAHNPSCNSIYRTQVFRNAGGFSTDFWAGEDLDLDRRLRKAGGMIYFNSKAVVFHYRRRDMAGFCRVMNHYGWAQAALLRRHGFFRFIQFVPFLSLGALIACIVRPWLIPVFMLGGLVIVAVKRISWSTLRLVPAAWWHWHAGFMAGLFRR